MRLRGAHFGTAVSASFQGRRLHLGKASRAAPVTLRFLVPAAAPSRAGAGTAALGPFRSPCSRRAGYRGAMYPRPKVGRLADRPLYHRARCREGLRREASRTTEATGYSEEPLALPRGPHQRRRRRRRGSQRAPRARQGSLRGAHGSTWLSGYPKGCAALSEGAGGPKLWALPIVAVSTTGDSDQLPRSFAVARGTYAIEILATNTAHVKTFGPLRCRSLNETFYEDQQLEEPG